MSNTVNGNFTIYNDKLNYLSNLKTLNITSGEEKYGHASYDVGLHFPTVGFYRLQINFNIITQNRTNEDFETWLFISRNSATEYPYPLQVINNQVAYKCTGPIYLEYDATAYCSGNDGISKYNILPRYGTTATGSSDCPLVLVAYPCKTDKSNNCYSNYYTFSCIFQINEPETTQTYYIQTAFDGGGNYQNGIGNVYIEYLG